ncbi:MAG: hypothetical protein QUU85_03300, partial [Candidatus Eisenbacteria bacterium]|nr:hypothetical protein [Candidatus Eisenbacteria bacterium]
MTDRLRPDDPAGTTIEQAASAYRERDALGVILPSPAWLDLSEEQRERLFDLQRETRAIERALDPQGLSGTGRAVLSRIARIQ